MNNNIENVVTGNNIYISGISGTDIEYSPLPIIDGNTQITEISVPFHLSTSIRLQQQMRYRNKSGFTGQGPIEYMRMGYLTEFIKHAKIDVCGSLFKDNKRGKGRMIQTDVLIFDIDNHLPLQRDLMDDETLHLTIDGFTELFKDYDFLISTSLNHMKEKGDLSARQKFHVFMGLGRIIDDENEVHELIKKLDYYIKSQTHNYEKVEIGSDKDYSLIDGAIGSGSQVWGNEDTDVYYNKGGTIYDLLYEKTFSDNFRRHQQHSGEYRNRRYKENKTVTGDYELNKDYLLDDWDYVNIISRVGLNDFYDIAFKMGGGYYMGYCDFHEDDKPSLQIFENGGYNCLGCQKSGVSALDYKAKKTNLTCSVVRENYIKKLDDITKQDFLIWLDDKNKLKKLGGDDVVVDEKLNEVFDASVEAEGLNENDDEYFLNVTSTGSLRANKKVYVELEKMNEKHAILSNKGKIYVMGSETDRHSYSDYKEFSYPNLDDFKKRYKNERYFFRSFTPTGKPIFTEKDIGSAWELWEHRRQYDGIDFHPYDDRTNYDDELVWDYWDDWESATKENGWVGENIKRGLSKFMDINVLTNLSTKNQHIDALEGCSWWMNNVSHNVLGNYKGDNHKRFLRYLIAWCSRGLTHHGRDRTKIVPVLKGNQGTGKGMFASRYGELFGKHFLHIQNSKQVGQRFNMQMMDALLVYVNEAVFAGNKETQNQLKGLITEDEIQLEQKYLPSFMGKSHMRFVYSSNEEWVVPIEWDNRRYWMLEVTNPLSGTEKDEYFDKFMQQWNLIGKESLYKYLTSDYVRDFSKEIRFESEMPLTSASSIQLILNDDVYGWLHSVIEKGGHYIYGGGTTRTIAWQGTEKWSNTFSIDEIMADYIKYNRDRGVGYSNNSNMVSNRIGKVAQRMGWGYRYHRITKKKAQQIGSTTTVWQFDNLDKIREIWVKELFNGSYEDARLATDSEDNTVEFSKGSVSDSDDYVDMPSQRRDRMKGLDFSGMKVDEDDDNTDVKSYEGFKL